MQITLVFDTSDEMENYRFNRFYKDPQAHVWALKEISNWLKDTNTNPSDSIYKAIEKHLQDEEGADSKEELELCDSDKYIISIALKLAEARFQELLKDYNINLDYKIPEPFLPVWP